MTRVPGDAARPAPPSALAAKAARIMAVLDGLFPAAPIPLDHVDPFTLLVAVVLELSGGARDEELASWASGVVRSVLRLGGTAVLCSHDIDGPRRTDVVTPRRLDRALAAATPGPPAVAPMGAHLVQVGP